MSGETAARSLRSYRFAAAGLLTLLAAITFAHPSATRLHAWPWCGYTFVLWLIPCVLLLVDLLGQRAWTPPPRIVQVGLALLGLTVLASAVVSPFRVLSLPHVWPTFSGIALVLWLYGLLTRAPEQPRCVASLLAGCSAVFALVALGLWWLLIGPAQGSRNEFPFGHSNYTAGALVLCVPWIAWAAVDQRGWRRAGMLCVLVIALVALVTTGSRGGVLALAGIVAMSAVWLVFRSRWTRTQRALIVTAAIVIGIAAVFSNARLRELALGRGWSEMATESNSQRSAMLAAGLELGKERPLLGWGPGTVPRAYPLVRGSLRGGVDNVLQLHNSPVQVWATSGTAGLVAMLMITCALIARAPAAASRSAVGAAAVCSLAGYAAFALTDHQLDIPFINWMAAANVAVILACSAGHADVRQPSVGARRLTAMLVGLALLVPLMTTARDLLARRAYASDDLDQAIAWMPADPYYHNRYASDLLVVRTRTADAVERKKLSAHAIRHLEHALATDTPSEYAHFNLGWLLLDENPAKAAAHFTAAAQLAPTRGGVYLGLALCELALENRDAAIRALVLEVLNDPAFSTAPLWEVPDFSPLRTDVLQQLDTLAAQAGSERGSIERRVAWIRWWTSMPSQPSVPSGFSRASATFQNAAQDIEASQPLTIPQRHLWARLYQGWLQRDWTLVTPDPEVAAALERRANKHGDDFFAFLRAGTEDQSALLQTMRRVRPGSGVLAFHPDGPPLTDAFVVQENRVHAMLAQELFPPKGTVPAPLLLGWLSTTAGSPSDNTR